MTSSVAGLVLLIVTQVAPAIDGDADLTAMQRLLSTVDQMLGLAALTVAVVSVVWWLVRSRRDPLAGAPERNNTLREEMLALAIIVYLFALLALSGVTQFVGGDTHQMVIRLFVGSGAQLIAASACAVIAANSFDGGARRFFAGRGDVSLTTQAALTIAVAILAIGLCPVVLNASMAALESIAPGQEFKPHPTMEALHERGLPLGLKLVLWLAAVGIAPLAEEVFFRGFLQTFLIRVVHSRWVAISIAAVAFGLVHSSQPYAIPALIALAVFIGYVYERTGSLLPAIAIHAGFNLKTLVWDLLGAVPS